MLFPSCRGNDRPPYSKFHCLFTLNDTLRGKLYNGHGRKASIFDGIFEMWTNSIGWDDLRKKSSLFYALYVQLVAKLIAPIMGSDNGHCYLWRKIPNCSVFHVSESQKRSSLLILVMVQHWSSQKGPAKHEIALKAPMKWRFHLPTVGERRGRWHRLLPEAFNYSRIELI